LMRGGRFDGFHVKATFVHMYNEMCFWLYSRY
jgi:hypothetical protein